MEKIVKFLVHTHYAHRAGKHMDLRFEIPGSRNWASFAVPKGVPLSPNQRVLAIRTHDHSEEEALFTGDIPPGEYGAGRLELFDQGLLKLSKYTSAHIAGIFQGKKVKGLYHLISVGVVDNKNYKQQQYMLFKSKQEITEPFSISNKEKSEFNKLYQQYKGIQI